jgi:hypothetical protein
MHGAEKEIMLQLSPVPSSKEFKENKIKYS